MLLALDTNIILLNAENLLVLGKTYPIIVLTETVLDEVDSKKSGHSELAYQARQAGRILSQCTQKSSICYGDTLTVTELVHPSGPIFHIVSLSIYSDWTKGELSISNDRKILEALLTYGTHTQNPLIFMSNDIMCRIRAASLGFEVTDLKAISDDDYNFTIELEVQPDVFSRLHNLPIFEVNPKHAIENYNYIFIDVSSGQRKLATIQPNYLIDVLGKVTEADLRRQDAPPQNAGQIFFSRAIQDPTINIVVCDSIAGSGKTITAMSNAISLVKRGQYSGIYYIRSSVLDLEREEQIGFLSGNDEKLAPFFTPLHDTLDFIVRSNHKDSKARGREYDELIAQKTEKLIAQCNIQGIITMGIRGRTISDSIIIIDEAQNLSPSAFAKVLTRFGKNCKIIIIGSNRQIDHPYLTKYTNGFSVILDACRNAWPDLRLYAITLTKVLRSPIAEWAENLFTKK